jgi:ribosomal-protein-alanine N-acetyltransferase
LRTTWLHLFAADDPRGPRPGWERIWPYAADILAGSESSAVWAMTALDWLSTLLKGSGFADSGRVITYSLAPSRAELRSEADVRVVSMRQSDLASVERLDHAAFDPPWRMDSDALRETRRRSILAAVSLHKNRIAGYLMATPTSQGVHLTRLAVRPELQGRGIGRALIGHLVEHVRRRGAPRITVNTQSDNDRSHRLYRSLGFAESGESHPVFRFDLPRP